MRPCTAGEKDVQRRNKDMKRLYLLVLALAVWAALAACGGPKGQAYMNAAVLEAGETEILAECIDESTGQLTGTAVSISKTVVSAEGVPEIQPGDTIRVVYDFDKVDKKSQPVKIGHVYAIYLLDEDGNVVTDK